MNGKIEESTLYLKSCSNLETQVFSLYEALSKKINQPENSFILGFAYDSLKCAKTIEAILEYFDKTEIENMSCRKDIAELINGVEYFRKKIAKVNNVNYEMTCESLKKLSNLEDRLSSVYTSYLQSSLIRVLSDEFSRLAIDSSNFKKIFENFLEQKQKHKETIIEIIYSFETKEADRLRNTTPLVRYRNPDTWIRDSTLHTFPATPAQESPQT